MMHSRHIIILVGGIVALVLTALPGQTAGPADNTSLATRVVTQCAAVKEGDIVWISGGVRDIQLLEDLAVDVRKIGAFPMITIGSDQLTRRLITDVPPRFDSQTSRTTAKLFEMVDVQLSVDYGEDPEIFAGIPSDRLEAISRAGQPNTELWYSRNIRAVEIGNYLYPTSYLAKRFGVPLEDLRTMFWNSINIDYKQMETDGLAIKREFEGGKLLQITNSNGTDLKVQISGRTALVSDGIISDDDMKAGAAARQVFLPAGEVYLAPVPGTAEGTVVFDRLFYYGKEVNELKLVFKAGKVVAMTGKTGFEAVKERYDKAGTGKDIFAFIDIGINPAVVIPANSKIETWVASGMVAVGIGGNQWAGGENVSTYGLNGFLPGSTLVIDGRPLIKDGKLLKDVM